MLQILLVQACKGGGEPRLTWWSMERTKNASDPFPLSQFGKFSWISGECFKQSVENNFSVKGHVTPDITKHMDGHSSMLVFPFCPFMLCTSFTSPREWTRCPSLPQQMEGLFPGFNEGGLPEVYPQLPWSLICSQGISCHCLVSIEGTGPETERWVSWQTTFHLMWTVEGTGNFLFKGFLLSLYLRKDMDTWTLFLRYYGLFISVF